MNAPSRILIVRLSAIGDVIHGMPVLCALRDRFPRAELSWLVEERAAPLLEGHEALDGLLTVPRGWLKSPQTLLRLRRRLREGAFDVAVDVQGLAKSALAARLSGAPRRIGFGDEKGRELSPWLYTDRVHTRSPHVVDANLDLLRPLGIKHPRVRFAVPEPEKDRTAAEQILAEMGVGARFAVINPGAGWASKVWPADRYPAVARHLGESLRLPSLVIWGSEQEREWAEAIGAASGGYARPAPPVTLRQLAALLRRARLFVGADTGPLHLAAAVGTPCVGLFGPTPAIRNGPYGPGHHVLQNVSFEGTSRQRRSAGPEVMAAIRADEVCTACEAVLRRAA